jgi:hypothetical protein
MAGLAPIPRLRISEPKATRYRSGQRSGEANQRSATLVGAYGDKEVGLAYPLMRTLEAIRQGGARVSRWRPSASTISFASSPMLCMACRAHCSWRN